MGECLLKILISVRYKAIKNGLFGYEIFFSVKDIHIFDMLFTELLLG